MKLLLVLRAAGGGVAAGLIVLERDPAEQQVLTVQFPAQDAEN